MAVAEAPAQIPEGRIGPVEERELPPAPPLAKMIGPGDVLVGVGIASGEYILFPQIASQVGLAFLWAALVGLLTQFFINPQRAPRGASQTLSKSKSVFSASRS